MRTEVILLALFDFDKGMCTCSLAVLLGSGAQRSTQRVIHNVPKFLDETKSTFILTLLPSSQDPSAKTSCRCKLWPKVSQFFKT